MPMHEASTNSAKCSDQSRHCSSLQSLGGFSSFTGRKLFPPLPPPSFPPLASICCCNLWNSTCTDAVMSCSNWRCVANSEVASETTFANYPALAAAVVSSATRIASSRSLIVVSISAILLLTCNNSWFMDVANVPWSFCICCSACSNRKTLACPLVGDSGVAPAMAPNYFCFLLWSENGFSLQLCSGFPAAPKVPPGNPRAAFRCWNAGGLSEPRGNEPISTFPIRGKRRHQFGAPLP